MIIRVLLFSEIVWVPFSDKVEVVADVKFRFRLDVKNIGHDF